MQKYSEINALCIFTQDFIFLYRPKLANVKHIIKLTKSRKNCFQADISCSKLKISEIIDTSKKEYIKKDISGFICYCEPGVFEDVSTLSETLTLDLEMLKRLVPTNIYHLLQRSTPIWINKEITFGTVDNPTVGSTMCFHSKNGQVRIHIDKYINIFTYKFTSVSIYINT